MTRLRRLAGDRRGNAAVLIAGALPMLLGAAALAVDLGSAQLDSRRLQGVADAAALAAASDPHSAQSLAEASVKRAGWDRGIAVTIATGHYSGDPATAPDRRFAEGAAGANAVRVRLASASPTFFARVFGTDAVPLARSATAARIDMASFTIGSRLFALDGGLLNAYLSALTGSEVSLSVADYNALVGADVDLLTFIDGLGTTADLRAATFDDILDADVSVADALVAASGTLPPGDARSALVRLSRLAGVDRLRLQELIDLGPLGGQSSGGDELIRVSAMSLVTAMLQLASQERQVDLDLGAQVPGLAQTSLRLAIGERPAGSPWLTVTDSGEPVIRTAQARLYLRTKLGGLSLPGIGGIVALDLPVYTELASAEARLGSIRCDRTGRSVTLDARPGLGTVAIASIDPRQFDDFRHQPTLRRARLLDTLLVDIDGRAVVDLGNAEPWQRVAFSGAEIGDGTVHTVSSGHAVGSLTASLAGNLDLDVSALGLLRVPAGPIARALGTTLGLLAPALDGLIDTATGAVGVHYGQADLRVTGVRCGQPMLVG